MRSGKSVIITRKYRYLKWISVVNAAVLIVTLVTQFFITGPSVFNSRAEEILVCMRICTVGDPCDPGICANPPSVSTQAVSNIGTSSAKGNGTVVSDGGDSITERGIVIAETANPTTDDTTFVASTNGTGSYVVTLSGLSHGTTYYARAYAINSIDTSYGSVVSFTTSETGNTDSGQQQNQSQGSGTAPVVDTRPVEEFLRENATAPTNEVQSIRNRDLSEVISVSNSGPLTLLSFSQPTFYGTTSIKDAYIYVSTARSVSIGTTVANSAGQWGWQYPTPLPPGTYTLDFTAVSPANYSIKSTHTVVFAVISLDQPDIGDTELPSAPEEDVNQRDPETPEFIVDVDIIEEGSDSDGVSARTRVINLGAPETKEVDLIFRVIDEAGRPVYEERRTLTVTDEALIDVRAVPSESLDPGLYTLQVTLDDETQQLITSENFSVEDPVVVDVPFISLQSSEVETGLRNTAIGLTASLAVLLLLLRREYIAFRKRPYHFSDNDLLHSNMIK